MNVPIADELSVITDTTDQEKMFMKGSVLQMIWGQSLLSLDVNFNVQSNGTAYNGFVCSLFYK
jgi:hypothetical protein